MSLVSLLRKNCRKTLFTTPSHSQEYFIFHKLRNLYKYDISETDFHKPEEALYKAESRAKNVYGTKCTKFLANGSTSGIIASVLACVKSGEKVLIWKDAHPCHKNSLTLAGAEPVYYETIFDSEWGVPKAVDAVTLEKFLKKEKISAVIITSPTYEGFCANLKEIKDMCKKYGAYLIVDEAHGALYPFSEDLPQSAVRIADFTVQSLHKTAGGLNPTALAHSNCEKDLDGALRLITTTSPSYPMLASIEANINFLNSKKGKKKISFLISQIKELHFACQNCIFGGDDITKILVKIPSLSGYELSEKLYEKYNIEDEKTNDISTMLLTGIGTSDRKIERLKYALRHIY